MIEERESAGYLLGETANLLRVNAGNALASLAIMTVLAVASDLNSDFAGPGSFVSLIVTLILQYQITVALLVHYRLLLDRHGRRRLWALLALNLLSGIGILLGLILLIVPGVYLLVRWSAAVPALIGEEAGVTEALGRSAEAVEGRFWHVLAALMVLWTPFLLGSLGSELVPDGQPLIESMVMNLPINFSLIAGWHLAVAIYAGRQDSRDLAEVFA